MKRTALLKKLSDLGCELVRHGGKHDWYINPTTKVFQAVPRHTEINEVLARSIIRKLS